MDNTECKVVEVTEEFNQDSHNSDIEKIEGEMLQIEQVECPVKHHYAPGVYCREIFMPKGSFVIGHKHKTKHFNIVLSGRARVMCNNEISEISAPHIFVSGEGVRKVLYIIEDMKWATIHPTDETDLDNLEQILIEKSDCWKEFQLSEQKCKELMGDK